MNVTHSVDRLDPAWPVADAELLARVDHLLHTQRAEEALALVNPGIVRSSPWLRNARGVCLLRLGRAAQAIDVLRELVFAPNELVPRPDAEPVFQANFAVALLYDGNTDGFHAILDGIRDRTHPAVAKLADAVRRWRADLTLAQRVRLILGGGPPLVLDFQPGSL